MNRLYPLFLKVDGRRALVVGGGNVAEQKVKGLLACGAGVTVIAPAVTSMIDSLELEGSISLLRRRYQSGDVEGYSVVFGATDDSGTQELVFSESSRCNIPVNIADKPELCTFYLGSVFSEGDLKVAVSTNGKSPTLGKIIRDKVAAEFSDGYPEIVDRIGQLREDIQNTFPGYESRKRVHEQFVKSELMRIGGADREAGHGTRNSETENRRREPGEMDAEVVSIRSGRVSLIGAGPGDPELISVKGLNRLRIADVVLYDALVSEELLSESPRTAEMIYAGKRAGAHCTKQNEINELLIAKAKEGKLVVRLKGGDPFIFGRGGEELDALHEAGIEVEVIPGITSGIGVPTSLGLPLTHRSVASSVLFITGHEDPAKPGEGVDWEAIPRAGTAVIYMGAKRLVSIRNRLIDLGVPVAKPVAVIFGGTTDGEKVIIGTLEDICERVSDVSTDLPGLIVIGETVRLFGGRSASHTSIQSITPGQEGISLLEQFHL